MSKYEIFLGIKQAFWIAFIALFLFSFSSCKTRRSEAIVDYGKGLYSNKEGVVPDTTKAESDSVEVIDLVLYEQQLQEDYNRLADKALRYYLKAQAAMLALQYTEALNLINLSLNTHFSADACALKGSILYQLGYVNEAFQFWKKAYEANPESINAELPGFRDAYESLTKKKE